jgi:hypothetical protein
MSDPIERSELRRVSGRRRRIGPRFGCGPACLDRFCVAKVRIGGGVDSSQHPASHISAGVAAWCDAFPGLRRRAESTALHPPDTDFLRSPDSGCKIRQVRLFDVRFTVVVY